MQIFLLVLTILSGVAAIIYIYKTVTEAKSRQKLVAAILFITLISVFSILYVDLYNSREKLIDNKIQEDNARTILATARGDLAILINLYEATYSKIGKLSDSTIVNELVLKSEAMANTLKHLKIDSTWYSLACYKSNIETYTVIIVTSVNWLTHRNGKGSSQTMKEFEINTKIALEKSKEFIELIDKIFREYRLSNKHEPLINFLKENYYQERAYYLHAWSLAFKWIVEGESDQRTVIEIHDLIEKIPISYKDKFPIQDNFFLNRIPVLIPLKNKS